MRNIFLSFIMLFSNSYSSDVSTKVEKIEYLTSNYINSVITLDIQVKAVIRDIVELKIYFCDQDKVQLNGEYYSSALVIDGNKNTQAKIPYNNLINKIYLNIIVYSSNKDEEIEDIMFPIYPRESLECNLNESKICTSNYPSLITYEDRQIVEKHENIAVINDDLTLNSFNNLVPINKLRLLSTIKVSNVFSYLKLEEKLQNFNIYYDESYMFELNVYENNGVITLGFANGYYIDMLGGKTSENYIENGIYAKEIMLPYEDGEYEFILEMRDSFISFELVKLSFTVSTSKYLIGACSEAKYCIRRNYR